MKNELILLTCLVLACTLTGCNQPGMTKLAGQWEIEKPNRIQRRVGQEEVELAPETPMGAMEYQDEPVQPRMSLILRANGTFQTVTQMGAINQSKKGSWRIMDYTEGSKTIRVSFETNIQTSEHEIEFVDEDTIRLVPPNMAGLQLKLRFKRKKE
ncbi:MAG: hypothetical protein AAF623_05180 [Planctomycetota bacterium]